MPYTNNNQGNLLSSSITSNSIAAKYYLLFAAVALILFYYAHAEWIGVEKAFYVPCGAALISSFCTKTRWDRIDTLLALYLTFMFLSDFLNGIYPNAINSPSIRILFGILCFNKLRKLQLDSVITYISKLSPLIVLSYYVFANPFEHAGWTRYGGFSGDPNFLAISLELLICINLIILDKKSTSTIWKCLLIATILGTLPLFIAGQSRMGIISLIVMILFYFHFLYKKSKKIFIIICILGGLISLQFYNANTKFFDGMINRFSMSSDRDVGAATSRLGQIDAALHILEMHPESWVIGIGADYNPLDIQEYSRMISNPVHNTFFSVLFQQGIVALLFFSLIIWNAFKFIRKRPPVYKGAFIALLLNISSVPSINYLTFWWTLFFLMNHPQVHSLTNNSFKISVPTNH